MIGRLGVCSWSLQPTTAQELIDKIRVCGLSHAQIALGPICSGRWPENDTIESLRNAGIGLLSGMMAFEGEDYSSLTSIKRTGGVRPDQHWERNLQSAEAHAALAERLGLRLVTFHAGFLPHEPTDPVRGVMLDRLGAIADMFGARGITLGLETGQETASTLVGMLRALGRPNVRVNFDPANMLLYGMGNPVAALRELLEWVAQVHIKDARVSPVPGEWGIETAAGKGEVDWDQFFRVIEDAPQRIDLAIEREAGQTRTADVIAARRVYERHVWPVREAPPPAGSSAKPLGVGIVGLGFMGETHIRALRSAIASGRRARLVAVADRNPERRTGRPGSRGNMTRDEAHPLFDPTAVRVYEDPERLMHDPDVDVVSICTFTETHVPLAILALQQGKHVLVEKPVSLDSTAVQTLAERAHRAGRVCMPAMCMRFWPAWVWLKNRIDDGSLGRLRSITFQRLGARPTWAEDFYADTARSGAAIFDLHIHDADFIHWCFGPVRSVSSAGDEHHLTTLYATERGPRHVVAEGGWDHAPGWSFRMRYSAAFEHATADFDISRNEPLILTREGRQEAVPMPGLSGYDVEWRHLLDTVATGHGKPLATLEDALAVTKLLMAEARSAASGKPATVS
ncbi:MAG: Gfo/Idh/MocA family oxidoreductase [Phycisphaeraceae bacterium]|nr:Gfo/Idh/MocA family oxidoreductase [Phycisphaeraceae bacterium]